jgi:hypothetical protein
VRLPAAEFMGIVLGPLILILVVGCSIITDSKKDQSQEIYKRRLVPCEVVKNFEMCCGIFSDKFLITEKNRYKIHERDNIVVGDSVCVYEWGSDKSRTQKFIKNKDITIYE